MDDSPAAKTRVTKYVRFAETIRQQVRSGQLKPGDRLPSYTQVQAQYGISQSTLERVYALLEQENLIVRAPKLGTFVAEPKKRHRANVLGLAIGSETFAHPYYTRLLHGIQEVAQQEEVEILTLHKSSVVNWEKMDGVLLVWAKPKLPPAMPAVSLLSSLPGIPSIVTDDYEGTKAATRHLISLGHRHIGYLALGLITPDHSGGQRLQGYKDALAEAGITVEPNWLRSLLDPWEQMRDFTVLGYEKMKEWMYRGDWEKSGCTALLTQNDEAAIGAVTAMLEDGMKVPGEVSVVGFDGIDTPVLGIPRLTTMEVPLREIGAAGVRLLLRRIGENSLDTSLCQDGAPVEMIPTRLRIGESTAPPSAAS